MSNRLSLTVLLSVFILGVPLLASAQEAAEQEYAYSVQVGAYPSLKHAMKVKDSFRKKGYKAYIFKGVDAHNRDWFVVRVYDFNDLQRAVAAAIKLRNKNIPAAITYNDSLKPVKIKELVPDEIIKDLKVVAAYDEMGPGDPSDLETPYTPSLFEEEAEKSPIEGMDTRRASKEDLKLVASEMLDELREQIKMLEEEVEILQEESEVRKKLEITEAERQDKEKEILSATGRDYTLNKKGTLSLDYRFSYTYNSFDVLRSATNIEHSANHSLNNIMTVSFAVLDNLTINSSIPFVYKYDQQGSTSQKSVTDLGDVSFGAAFQPFKTGGDIPSITINTSFSLPMGRSPYDIDPNVDLATGSGMYSANGGVSLSKTIDPVVVFGGGNFTHTFDVTGFRQNRPDGRILEKVNPGDRFGVNMGFGYSLSYIVNINLSYSYSYVYKSTYYYMNADSTSSISNVSSNLSLGVGLRLSTKRSLNMTFSFGLTNADSDFSMSFSVPFDFKLFE